MEAFDYAIIGGGMAGASLAWQLVQPPGTERVLLLERESQPGYHSTGRSAALYMATYGTPQIRALTRASRAFFNHPPAGFCSGNLLTPRSVLHIAGPDQLDRLEATWQELRPHSPSMQRLDAAEMLALAPCLRPDAIAAGLLETDGADMDVDGLHQGYLRGLRQAGGSVRTQAEVVRLERGAGLWTVHLADGTAIQARTLVNAAGAWADGVGQLAGAAPIRLTPCRRTAFTFAAPEGLDLHRLPMLLAMDESFYIKPDAGQLLGSPANADPTHPHDVVPEEIDVATGIWHIEQMTTFQIRRPSHTWAGLRSFVPDGDMVIGWDGQVEGLFWLAALGGYGIQSAPGYSLLARNLLRGEPLDATLVTEGVDPQALSPRRGG